MAEAPGSGGMPTAVHGSRRPDLPRLTAMRGIGAIMVVIGHFALTKSLPTEAMNDWLIDLLQAVAVAGVSCFFTFSGFVLTWVTPPGSSARKLWRRRFARLYPVHAVMWLVGLLTMLACGVAFEFSKMLPSLALVNIWVPDLEVFWGANTPSWTLACEAFFYLLFPALLLLAWKLPERWLYPAVALVIALAVLWAGVVGLLVPGTHDVTDGTPISRAQYFAIIVFAPARLLDFTLGILLARVVIAGKAPDGLRVWAWASVFAGYVVARWVVPQPLGFVFAFMPAIVIGLLYTATRDLAAAPTRFVSPPLLWLGEISFALYLVHWPILFGVHRALGDPQWPIHTAALFGASMLAVSIALAHVLHTRVELPLFYRLGGGKRPRRVAKPAVTVAPSS